MPNLRSLLNLRVIAGVICVALVAAVYFGEWIEVSSNGGYSVAALRNRYLAAEQFLDRFDIRVESSDGLSLLDELPPTSDTVLIASSRQSLSQRRVETLMQWVQGGGRLIVFAGDYWDPDAGSSGDKLLDDIGVRLLEAEEFVDDAEIPDMPAFEDLVERLSNQNSCRTGNHTARISLVGEEQDITTSMDTSGFLDFQGDYEYSYAANAAGPQLLYVEVGDGAMVVLTSLWMWTNRQIHCHDHAHLLRWLTDDRPVLWWLFNTEMQSLPSLLWKQYPVLVAGVGIWIALWAWRSGRRVQRIPALPDPARRELTEHIDGVGRFYWQQNAADRLLQPLRRLVLRGGEPSDEVVAALASRSGIDAKRVRWALTESVGNDSGSFLTATKVLFDLSKLNG